MDKFAVDLDKVLDELEQSEGLLSEKLPEAQLHEFEVPRPSTQTIPKCRGDVPRQNGDHSAVPPPVLPSANAQGLTDSKKPNSDEASSGKAFFWDGSPATVLDSTTTSLYSQKGVRNAPVHTPSSASPSIPLEATAGHLRECVDSPGACSVGRNVCVPVQVSGPDRTGGLRDSVELPSYSSAQLPPLVAPSGNTVSNVCGGTVSKADVCNSSDGGVMYNGQVSSCGDEARLGTNAAAEQLVLRGEPKTLPAASEANANRVSDDGAFSEVLPKSSVPQDSFQYPDLLTLSPVGDTSVHKTAELLQSLISLSPDDAKIPDADGTKLLPHDGSTKNNETNYAPSLLDSDHCPPDIDLNKASSSSRKGSTDLVSSRLPDSQVVPVPQQRPQPLLAASGDNATKQETVDGPTCPARHTLQLSSPASKDETAPTVVSEGPVSDLCLQDNHKTDPATSVQPSKGNDVLLAEPAEVPGCDTSEQPAFQSPGPANIAASQEQQVCMQPSTQDATKDADALSTSPSEASSALPATPPASPPKVRTPDPAMLSYSPPRSSSAPPGVLPASPVRASSASSSPVSSASTGPSTDVPDDTSHSEGVPADSVEDEATVISEARCLDEDPVVGFDTVPDVTDEELDRLLQEEEGEGEQNFLPPLSEEEQMLGKVKPFWIPDEEAPACMLCFGRFTVLKRRHHCRACGKVLCSSCCNQKAPLPCLENREGRVCLPCLTILQRVAAVERLGGPSPANPAAYCSRGPPPLHGAAQSPPLTVLVPVLRRGPRPDGEAPKQVMFSDGIRPGGDLSDEVMPSAMPGPPRELSCPDGPAEGLLQERRVVLSDIEGSLPPVALSVSQRDLKLENENDLMIVLQDPNVEPVAFALTRNLHVLVKIVTVECGGKRQCWNFCSRGLCTLGLDEVVLLLEREPGESQFPRDALRLFATLQGIGATGGHRPVGVVAPGVTMTTATAVGAFQCLPFPEGVLGSSDHGGFLLLPHMGQRLDGLVLPRPPWLCAVLLQRMEMPWARLLPLRLLLRLGAEFEVYPYPMVSIRGRRSVYAEIGHTIMTVLLDFRNFQYQLASLSGLLVQLEGRQTTVRVPRNRYDALVRVLDGNEHVLALAGNMNPEADAHLVCVQAPDAGTYHSQALQARPGSLVECTGASFVVFSGALKGPGEAKHSIVEDGVLVQLSPASMGSLRTALRAMRDWHVPAVPASPGEDAGHIAVIWTEDDRPKNKGVQSPIDGRSLEGITGVRLRAFSDFCARGLCLRWTEFFLLSCDGGPTWGGCEDPQRAAEGLARAFCEALLPHMTLLQPLSPLGLRAQLGPDQVGYEAGAQGQPLPVVCQEPLDCALVPLLTGPQEPMHLEMLFHVIYQ
ncbi:zinc finger FYVE domain-containing protein 9 [Dermacentor albipictus]|uniref:zinc finger FYVE domain-containing protein 9 n=1 Tax=Dermacentor albipictus TaxID=60249 RepID=UPI0038FCD455